jgi:hypothetical protein
VLPGNLGYISGYLIPNGATIDSALAALQNTDGLVVDMRGYPREATFWLTRRLTDVPLRRPKVEIPIAMWKPGAESAACCGRLRVQTDELELRDGPRYRKPVVVLINAVPQSAAEADVMILRQRPRVRVVGTPTTGAVGTVTQVLVPSGARFFFTGSVWYNPDGSRVQNVGILPDVHVAPTIRGVRAGRDEILEAGIGVLKEMLAGQLGR